MRIGEVLFDITPVPVYRAYCWVKDRPKEIKWWFQRANGKLPVCDLWTYKETLVESIIQGLEYLTRPDGVVDWQGDKQHWKMYKDLVEAKHTFKEIRYHIRGFVVICDTREEALERDGDCIHYISKQDYEAFEKRKSKAFRTLDKYLWGLWD